MSSSPPLTLPKVTAKTLRRKPRRKFFSIINGPISLRMKANTGVNILGHGLCDKPADFLQCGTPENGSASTIKTRVGRISSRLDDLKKKILFMDNLLFQLQISLIRIWVVKMMGRLNKSNLFIFKKPNAFL